MIDEFLSAWFAWCKMKKNGNEERREEGIEEEIEEKNEDPQKEN